MNEEEKNNGTAGSETGATGNSGAGERIADVGSTGNRGSVTAEVRATSDSGDGEEGGRKSGEDQESRRGDAQAKLADLRNRRAKKNAGGSVSENRTTFENLRDISARSGLNVAGNADNPTADGGRNLGSGRTDAGAFKDHNGADLSGGSDATVEIDVKGLKPKQKNKKLVEPEAGKPLPPQEEIPEKITKNESKEMIERMKSVIRTANRGIDSMLTATNKQKQKAIIWATMDNEEISVIATHIVEMGMASHVVAQAVRRITQTHRLLEIGVITLPRFVSTYRFYLENGLMFPMQIKSEK